MYRNKLLIIALLATTAMCSCKRQYICYCDKVTPNGAQHYSREIWEKSEGKAKTECEKQNGQYLWDVNLVCRLK